MPVVDVAEHAPDAVGHEAAGQDHLVDAVAASQSSMNDRNGRPASGITGFGRRVGERPQPRALAAREDQRLQRYLAPTPS